MDRLFGWLVQEEQIEKNPADGIRSQQEAGEAANTKRLPFKPDQSAAGQFRKLGPPASAPLPESGRELPLYRA